MASEPLHASSLAEAFFYLLVTPCRICSKGPLRADLARGVEQNAGSWRIVIPSVCRECGQEYEHAFTLPEKPTSLSPTDNPTINDTDVPSRLIDVGQWIVLFRMVTEAAAGERDKQQARQLGIEAAMCLEESLKFYNDQSDLPSDDAFFVETSRDRFRDHPEQFSRTRLLALRAKLPSISYMRSKTSGRGETP